MYMLKTIKQLKLMMKIMVPHYQRILLKFSKTNVLDDTSSGTDSEDKDNIVKLMHSENETIKENIAGKVNQAFEQVQNNYGSNGFDPKLMLGIIQKRIPDHDLNGDDLDENQFMEYFESSRSKSRPPLKTNKKYKSFQVDKIINDHKDRLLVPGKNEDEKYEDSY